MVLPAAARCQCSLPSCSVCCSSAGDKGWGAAPMQWRSDSKGHASPQTTLRLVAAVHDELELMLSRSDNEQWLSQGRGWYHLPTAADSKGSRLAKVVTRLCRCGITTVQQARRMASIGMHVAPQTSGVKRGHGGREHGEGDAAGRTSSLEGPEGLWEKGINGVGRSIIAATPRAARPGRRSGALPTLGDFSPTGACYCFDIGSDNCLGPG